MFWRDLAMYINIMIIISIIVVAVIAIIVVFSISSQFWKYIKKYTLAKTLKITCVEIHGW